MGSTHDEAMKHEYLPFKLQEIVNENKSTLFLLNPYFRIQKNDEESQKKYKSLKYNKINRYRKYKMIYQIPKGIIKVTGFFVGSLFFYRQIKYFKTNKLNAEALFISHATKNNIYEEKDLFFADLPKLVNKENCTVLYLNHTRGQYSKILKKLTEKQISKNVLLMPKFLHPLETKEFLRTILGLLSNHLRLASKYRELEPIKANILMESIPWIFSRETYNNFNLVKRTVELQKIHLIRNVFLTLEGYNYEELLATHLTSKNRDINLYFYQHSPLTKAHTGFQLFITNFTKKICILTTGTAYSSFLRGLSNQNEVICVGSQKVMKPIKPSQNKGISILITPEGKIGQTEKFLQFTLRIAKVCPSIFFIFRLHPNLVLKRTTKKLIRAFVYLDNIEISTESLACDISRTKATMYTGSAAVIEALNSKNLPIFVDFEDNLNLDVFSIASFNYPRINPLNFEVEINLIVDQIDDLKGNSFNVASLYQQFQLPQKLVNRLKA